MQNYIIFYFRSVNYGMYLFLIISLTCSISLNFKILLYILTFILCSFQNEEDKFLNGKGSASIGDLADQSSPSQENNSTKHPSASRTRSRTDLCPEVPRSKYEHSVWNTWQTWILQKNEIDVPDDFSNLNVCFQASTNFRTFWP